MPPIRITWNKGITVVPYVNLKCIIGNVEYARLSRPYIVFVLRTYPIVIYY